jgi:FkbM family methyltransferase
VTRKEQFRVLRAAIRNWPAVLIDRLGLQRVVRYRTRSGLTVYCRARTTDVGEVALILGEFEYPPELVRVSAGGVIVDVGANIGAFCLLCAQSNEDFRGVAFEPYRPSCELLERNLAANQIESFVVEQAAISDIDGPVSLVTDLPADRIHIGDGDTTALSWRLSTYCGEHDIDRIALLKVDAEGAEYPLVDFDLTFLAGRVDRMLIEWHDLDPGRQHGHLIDALSAGFDVQTLHSRGLSGVLYAVAR